MGRWLGKVAAPGLCGALPALAFPEPSWWWWAYVALVPLLLLVLAATSARDAGMRAWWGGTGFFFAIAHWLVPNVGPGLIPIALVLGLSWIPWGWVAWHGGRARSAALAVVAIAAAWITGEIARSIEYLGGPWGLLGASQWNNPPVLELASLAGVWGIGFVVCAVNAALALAIMSRNSRLDSLRALAVGALIAGAAVGYGVFHVTQSDGLLRVAGAQPGVLHDGSERFEQALTATQALTAEEFDLVVWGESSVGAVGAQPETMTRLEDTADALDTPILVNIDMRRGAGGIYKSSVLIGEGTQERYDKMRMVPFGEYIPLRSIFGWLPAVSDAPEEDRQRGNRLQILDSDELAIGPLVCFESAFPDMARGLAALGADVIVVQSATTTFQGSWAPEQHASLAALRAVETGRPVIHATLSGVSAAFDASGRRHAWFGTDRTGTYMFTVPLSATTTLYTRTGPWLPITIIVLALAGAALLRGRPRESRDVASRNNGRE
jgi:apolipoprotein N-acyltransferase